MTKLNIIIDMDILNHINDAAQLFGILYLEPF